MDDDWGAEILVGSSFSCWILFLPLKLILQLVHSVLTHSSEVLQEQGFLKIYIICTPWNHPYKLASCTFLYAIVLLSIPVENHYSEMYSVFTSMC